MNKISIIYKGLLVLLLCIALGVAILQKVMSPTVFLKNDVERLDSELVQKRMKLSMIDNFNTDQFSIKNYHEIQSFILASINRDPKVNVTRFSEIDELKDSNYIDYDFTISGSQADLLIWLNSFEQQFKGAIFRASTFESKQNSNDLFLTVYLRSIQK
tara:strand:+ start:672 stop:1145 length:474 start_codon:yes stop_codon:yes gene_type:complete